MFFLDKIRYCLFTVGGRQRFYHPDYRMEIVAFRRSCHLVEGVSWCGEGSVGRRVHHWSSLTETWPSRFTSMSFCVPLLYHFSNSSHVLLFISMTTPDPIQPEWYKTSLEPKCYRGLQARQTCPQYNISGMSWIHIHSLQSVDKNRFRSSRKEWLRIPRDVIWRLIDVYTWVSFRVYWGKGWSCTLLVWFVIEREWLILCSLF